MTSYGRGGGFNTYKEVQAYQDDWGKPITTVSDYPDHVYRPVIVDVHGNGSPILSYSTEHRAKGYVVRSQRIVEVRRSYEIPLNSHLDEYNMHEEWDDHSPSRKVNDFFSEVHNEASRPTHPTLLSPPKLITNKPSWRSTDHDSPKNREHHDFSGSPLRNKFEGLHLQDYRGSSPYKYNKDGYAHSMGSPKASHPKDYGVDSTWDSPPRSRSTHEDWHSRRNDDDDYVNKDDYGRPKFNGGYKTTGLPLSQATNDIGTAMKILGGGNIPLASHAYVPQSHFPASYSSPHIKKESYPERTEGGKPLASSVSTHPSYYATENPITERKESYPESTRGGKPLASSVSTRPSYYPTSSPITERKESYPEPTKGVKPLFSRVYTQQPHSTTSNPAPQKKESYPETTHGSKPLFSPVHTQQPHSPTSNSTPQRKESYPETTHGAKPLFSSVYSQQPHSTTSNPAPQKKESYPETTHGSKNLFSPVHTQQPHSPTSNSTPQRKESYPETTHGAKPLFSSVYSQQPHSPTSNPIPQRKENYPETTHVPKPLFSRVYSPTSNPMPQRKESYPDTTHGPEPLFPPAYTPQSHSPTSHPTAQRKESYPETEHSIKPMFSPVYTPQSHSPTSKLTSQRKESYPETEHNTNPMFSPVSIQPSHSSTANPTSQDNGSYPKKTKGWKSLFSPAAKQQPHPPTSHSAPEMKQSNPDHDTRGRKPSFSPSPQRERYSPQMQDHYSDQIQRSESFPSPYENTQEPRYGAIAPPKETLDSSEARKKYANLKPVSPAQMKYSGTIDSRAAVEKYKGAFVP